MTHKMNKNLPFEPDFKGGLLPVIAQDARSGDVLMLAWMNREAWEKTLASGEAYYWSRSRQELWHKGEISGNIQIVREIFLDCDNDAILLHVEQQGGAACHTGRASCFYRRYNGGDVTVCSPLVFNPAEVYGKQ